MRVQINKPFYKKIKVTCHHQMIRIMKMKHTHVGWSEHALMKLFCETAKALLRLSWSLEISKMAECNLSPYLLELGPLHANWKSRQFYLLCFEFSVSFVFIYPENISISCWVVWTTYKIFLWDELAPRHLILLKNGAFVKQDIGIFTLFFLNNNAGHSSVCILLKFRSMTFLTLRMKSL